MARRENMPQDRRVLRSRAAIRTALYELVSEKPFAQLSVTELAERAGINRKTFYAHYASLDDVLAEIEEEFAAGLARVLAESDFSDTGTISDVVNCVEVAVRENFELLRCMAGERAFDVIRRRVEEATQASIAKKLEQYPGLDAESREYVAQFLAAGVVAMFIRWLRSESSLSLGEVARKAEQIIYYGLSSQLPAQE